MSGRCLRADKKETSGMVIRFRKLNICPEGVRGRIRKKQVEWLSALGS